MSIYNLMAGYSAAPFSAAYVGQAGFGNTNSTSDTFSSVNIGTPDPSRIVVYCASGANAFGGTGGMTSVTCNGVSMVAQTNLTTSRSPASIWTLNVPTGTTATFVQNHYACNMFAEIYVLYNTINAGTATNASSAYTASTLPSMTLTMPNRGAAIYMIWNQQDVASATFSLGTINDLWNPVTNETAICGIYTPTTSGSATNTVSGYTASLASYACASFV